MTEPLAELAAYSGPWYQVPDADLVRLTAAARAAGHRWDVIAAACDNGPGTDIRQGRHLASRRKRIPYG